MKLADVVARVVVVAVVAGLSPLAMWGIPTYGVWRQGLIGQASLARAEQEKRIAVEQAKAEVESAKLRAEAIEIVGLASQKFPEYRTQEFIGAFADAMQNGNIDKVIYVPTEANIPIIEARSSE